MWISTFHQLLEALSLFIYDAFYRLILKEIYLHQTVPAVDLNY
jgi:hypothetical protein